MKISLKSQKTSVDTTVTFLLVTVSGTDAVFYQNAGTSSLSLPVNPHEAQTTFTLYHGSRTDFITVSCQPLNVIISPDCGAYVYFKDLVIDSTSLTTYKVINNQLSTSATVNIEVKI